MKSQEISQGSYIDSKAHCHGCGKADGAGIISGISKFSNFIIVFWYGHDLQSGEPLVRDGVFSDNRRIAIMKACDSCGPKILRMKDNYSPTQTAQEALKDLNDGPLKKMLREIWPRRKASWRLEIGWEFLLPVMEDIKRNKMSQRSENDS